MKKHSRPEIREYRKNLTSAEAFLWKYLSRSHLEGRKFRRQHSIENFIVDFYCASEKLIVELDGEIHMNPTSEEKDEIRDKRLKTLGFEVLRFENKLVFDDLQGVLNTITEQFDSQKSSPAFQGGE